MKFEVIGKVQGKQRPRFGKGRTYTPKQTTDYERAIRESFIQSNGEAITGPIALEIQCYKKIAKSVPKYKRKEMHDCIAKPDADNIAKVVMDALNGAAYEDDSQVSQLSVEKLWTEEEEKIIISIGEKNATNEKCVSNDNMVYTELP